MFDHDHTRLNLRVQTDKVGAATQVERHKDAKALSGGETSFSTCCLLLTMWDSVGCPVRCLDEFDVFMVRPARPQMIPKLELTILRWNRTPSTAKWPSRC